MTTVVLSKHGDLSCPMRLQHWRRSNMLIVGVEPANDAGCNPVKTTTGLEYLPVLMMVKVRIDAVHLNKSYLGGDVLRDTGLRLVRDPKLTKEFTPIKPPLFVEYLYASNLKSTATFSDKLDISYIFPIWPGRKNVARRSEKKLMDCH